MLTLNSYAHSFVRSAASLDTAEKDAVHYMDNKLKGALTPYVTLNASLLDESHVRTNPHYGFGLGVDYLITRRPFVFEAGLSYMPFGAEIKASSADPGGRLSLNYVGFPLTFKKHLNPFKTGAYFKAGLTPAYLAHSSFNGSGGGAEAYDSANLRRANAFVSAGLGANVRTALGDDMIFGLNYARSLLPIQSSGSLSGASSYTNSIIFSAGFLFL